MFKYKVHAHSEDGKVVDYAREQTNSEALAQKIIELRQSRNLDAMLTKTVKLLGPKLRATIPSLSNQVPAAQPTTVSMTPTSTDQ